jgi:4-phytase/acid phosphatase
MLRLAAILALLAMVLPLYGAEASPSSSQNEQLKLVVVISRHGVRAPIGSEMRGNLYNAQPWATWPVAPGVLTQHGADALRLMGAFYRERYAELFPKTDCAHAGIFAIANNSERTVASAHALLAGLAPGCTIDVHARQGRERDPLFGQSPFSGVADHEKLAAAILGRLGGRMDWWPNGYRQPLSDLQAILLNCAGPDCDKNKQKLLDSPSAVKAVPGGEIVSIETPVSIGADFAEHFLLQYTEGLPMEQVGWGRVTRPMLDHLMAMNTSYHDFILRTPYFAQIAASNLAYRLNATLEQEATGKATTDALAPAEDHFVLLAGHDSNLTWLAGLLRLSWLLPDQPRDATPPGSGFVFELYRNSRTGKDTVRVLFASQTLDQIRFLTPLDGKDQPSLVPVFVPGCSESAPGYPCDLKVFSRIVRGAIDEKFVEHSGRP